MSTENEHVGPIWSVSSHHDPDDYDACDGDDVCNVEGNSRVLTLEMMRRAFHNPSDLGSLFALMRSDGFAETRKYPTVTVETQQCQGHFCPVESGQYVVLRSSKSPKIPLICQATGRFGGFCARKRNMDLWRSDGK